MSEKEDPAPENSAKTAERTGGMDPVPPPAEPPAEKRVRELFQQMSALRDRMPTRKAIPGLSNEDLNAYSKDWEVTLQEVENLYTDFGDEEKHVIENLCLQPGLRVAGLTYPDFNEVYNYVRFFDREEAKRETARREAAEQEVYLKEVTQAAERARRIQFQNDVQARMRARLVDEAATSMMAALRQAEPHSHDVSSEHRTECSNGAPAAADEVRDQFEKQSRKRTSKETRAPLSEADLKKRQANSVSLSRAEAAACLQYCERTISNLFKTHTLTPTAEKRVVIDERFWQKWRKRHKPVVG